MLLHSSSSSSSIANSATRTLAHKLNRHMNILRNIIKIVLNVNTAAKCLTVFITDLVDTYFELMDYIGSYINR